MTQSSTNITFTPEIEQFIHQQIESGRYTSANEVILAGVQLLEERERIYKGRFEELKQEIDIGITASERGEVIDQATVFQALQDRLQSRRDQANL
jgi:antitoxin ParD1/3/4